MLGYPLTCFNGISMHNLTEERHILSLRAILIVAVSMLCGALFAQASHALGTWSSSVQAWVYPGNPACAAAKEYSDGRIVHVLKPEYYAVTSTGTLTLRTTATDGCNGYSPENAASIKTYSQKQYVTVSAGQQEMSALVGSAQKRSAATTTLSTFAQTIGFSGVELDFEGFSNWTSADYANYKTFLKELGGALHGKGLRLLVDGPAIGTATEQGYYLWKYEDFNTLPVDQIVVMTYDYQYDYGVGSAIAPNTWVKNVIRWTKSKITDIDKIVIGVPTYGYHGKTGSYALTIDTLTQSKLFPGYTTAQRDPGSYEMKWVANGTTYVYQDSTGLNMKRTLIEQEGIKNISVWHLGGNSWFSGNSEPTTSPTPQPCR